MAITITMSDTTYPAYTPLVTREQVRTAMGIDDSSKDSVIDFYVAASSDIVRRICNARLDAFSATQWLKGTGLSKLWLPGKPLTELNRVSFGTVSVASIDCTNSGAIQAYYSISESQIVLRIVGGGDEGSEVLEFADYPTLSELQNAMGALGTGWSMSIAGGYGNFYCGQLVPRSAAYSLNSASTLYMPATPRHDIHIASSEQSVLFKGHGNFPEGDYAVFVDWSSGYTVDTAPGSLQSAIIQIVVDQVFSSGRDSSMTSESIGDYQYSLSVNLSRIKMARYHELLSPWIRYTVE